MSARAILLILLLGLLAGALWLVLGPGSGRASKAVGATSAPRPIEELPMDRLPAELSAPALAEPLDPTPGRQEETPTPAEEAKSGRTAPEPDRTLQVRVLDERGVPQAGVPVRLTIDQGDGSSTVLPAKTRGAEGLATFLHVGVGWSLAAERCTATAAIAGIFEQPIERSFPFREWPAEPLELVLVAHGSVVVDVHDSDGQPLANVQRDVELKTVHEQVAGALLWNERGTSSAEVEDGRARFDVVGLGAPARSLARCAARAEPRQHELRGARAARRGARGRARVCRSPE